MSYDLYFTELRITEAEFRAYFEGRPNYQVEGKQAFYENAVTNNQMPGIISAEGAVGG